jgi:two-component system C4-dicarboxylate transport response regulator DctD
VRDLLVEILESLGHSPEGFDSAASALAGFEPGRFDLVFTDLGMPGMSGWDLSKLLRGRDPAVPIAIITGWGADVGPEALANAGADAVVSKPFAIEDIEGLARMARDRRERRAA